MDVYGIHVLRSKLWMVLKLFLLLYYHHDQMNQMFLYYLMILLIQMYQPMILQKLLQHNQKQNQRS